MYIGQNVVGCGQEFENIPSSPTFVLDDEALAVFLKNVTSPTPDTPKHDPKSHFVLDRIDRSISFDQLPDPLKNIFRGALSDEITLSGHLFCQVFRLFAETANGCPSDMKSLFNDYARMTPYLFFVWFDLGRKEAKPEAAGQLATVLREVVENLKSHAGRLSPPLRKNVAILEEILGCMIDPLVGKGLTLEDYDTLLWGIANQPAESTTVISRMEELQASARGLWVSFNAFFTLFIRDNEFLKAEATEMYSLWEHSKKTVTKYVEKLKQIRKKDLSLDSLIALNEATYRMFSPFTQSLMRIIVQEPRFLFRVVQGLETPDIDLHHLASLLPEEGGEEAKFSFNTTSYTKTAVLLKIALLDMRQKILQACCAQAAVEKLSFNFTALSRHLETLRATTSRLASIDLASAIDRRRDLYSQTGQISYSHFYNELENACTLLERRISLYQGANPHGVLLDDLIMHCFWTNYHLQHCIEGVVNDFVQSIRSDIAALQEAQGSQLPKHRSARSRVLRQQKNELNKLSETLVKAGEFLDVFDRQCEPVLDIIHDIRGSFLVPETPVGDSNQQTSEPFEKPHQDEVVEASDIPVPPSGDRVDSNQDKAPAQRIDPLDSAVKASQEQSAKEGVAPVRNVKWKVLLKEVMDAGYTFLRQRGSHMQFKNEQNPESGIVTIPRHGGKTVSSGVVNKVRTRIEGSKW